MKKTQANEVVRVMLVDDHDIVRQGLAALIQREPDFEICGEASDRAEALALVQETKPDIVVTDLALHDESGLELIKDIRTCAPKTHIVVLSMLDEQVYAPRCFQAGAMGYVMKEQSPRRLIEALRSVMDGDMVLSEAVSRLLARRLAGQVGPPSPSMEEQLTDRELEVFQRLGRGYSLNEIAEQLGLSPKTVDSYRERIKRKLGVSSAHALRQQAIEQTRHHSP